MSNGYAKPDVLVSTDWVAAHLNDSSVRLVESNEDVLLYDTGHVPGAINIDWHADLNDPRVRDYIGPEKFAALMRRNGISPETTVVFYGDKNNWWATYAFWVFQLFGHTNAKVMDGGRMKWIAEGRELSKERPAIRRAPIPRPSATTARFAPSASRCWRTRPRQAVGGRAQPRRVPRRVAAHGGLSPRGGAARRSYPRRAQCALGTRGEPGRYVQERRRTAGDL